MAKLTEKDLNIARPPMASAGTPDDCVKHTIIRGICMLPVSGGGGMYGYLDYRLVPIPVVNGKALTDEEVETSIADFEASHFTAPDNALLKWAFPDQSMVVALSKLATKSRNKIFGDGLGDADTPLDVNCNRATRLVYHLLHQNWFFENPNGSILEFHNVDPQTNADFCRYRTLLGGRTIMFDNWHETVGNQSGPVGFSYNMTHVIKGNGTSTPVTIDPKIRNDP